MFRYYINVWFHTNILISYDYWDQSQHSDSRAMYKLSFLAVNPIYQHIAFTSFRRFLKECKPIFLFTGLSRNDSNVDSPDVRHVVMDCYWRRKTDLFPCFSMISMSAFNIFWMLSGWADGIATTTTIIVTA